MKSKANISKMLSQQKFCKNFNSNRLWLLRIIGLKMAALAALKKFEIEDSIAETIIDIIG